MCPRGEIQRGCSSEKMRERGRKSPTAGRKCVRGVKVLRRGGYPVLFLETFQEVDPTANSCILHPRGAPRVPTAWE